MTIETGALEQGYAKVETSYRVTPADALVGSDGIRIIQLALTSKKNREASPEKRGTPDRQQSLPRRQSQQFNLSEIMWEPSGTLGTISNVGKFIKALFGSAHVLSLNTTVAAGAPTTTGCDLTSAAGVAVGDIIVFTYADGHREATRILTVSAPAITFDAVSAAPPVAGAAVVGITYGLANNVTESLAIYKYYNAGNFKQAVYGAVADQMVVTFDGTKEVMLAIQGPAGDYADSSSGGGTVQAKPGTHVTVGSPASGMVGGFYVDGNAFLTTMCKLTINNQLILRNKELGTSKASGIGGRNNLRDVTCEITFYLEDLNLIGKANSVVKGELRLVIGSTNGNVIAMVAPSVEFEIPDVPGDIGLKEITVSGICYAVSGNDQVILAEL